MRADWTASGGCTSGSTAPPKPGTRRASGGNATTSTSKVDAALAAAARTDGPGDPATPAEAWTSLPGAGLRAKTPVESPAVPRRPKSGKGKSNDYRERVGTCENTD